MPIETLCIKDLEEILKGSFTGNINIPWELQPRNHLNAHYRFEMEVMAQFCKIQSPKIAFEFGTYEGFTTLVIACNTRDYAKVFTLDFPLGFDPPISYDKSNASFVKCRYRLHFKGRLEERKIHQIIGDSKKVELSFYKDSVDLIFVDGCHQASYIENDTNKAFNMLGQGGIILWHDYKTTWPDVTPFLDSLSQKIPLYHIKGTNYVMFKDT